MNAPNRYELYILQDGEKAVEVTEDTKIPNAVTIKVVKQDHTMANMIRAQLLADPAVIFAGYKVPHPLEPYFVIKIQTDGTITPVDAFTNSCKTLLGSLVQLQKVFASEFDMKSVDDMEEPGARAGQMYGSGMGMDYGVGGSTRMRTHDYADF